MNTKPFIHPDILITVRKNLDETIVDHSDIANYSLAKHTGEEFATRVLKALFSVREEYGEVKSHFNTEKLSSEKLFEIREQIVAMHYQRKTFNNELSIYKHQEVELSNKLFDLKNSFLRMFYKKRIIRYDSSLNELRNKIIVLLNVNNESYINLRFRYEDPNIRGVYSDLTSAFTSLKSSNKIWDITMTQLNLDTKAAASTSITRNEIKIDFKGIDVIKTDDKALHIENYNGGDFYLYPNFVIYFKNNDEIALIDYSDLYILFTKQQFLEEEINIPADTEIIGETWYRVNKDGSPDRRFVGNYKIPIVHYGSLHFKTASGVNEIYYISDVKKAEHFVEQFNRYQSLIRGFR